MAVSVQFEIGHTAKLRAKKTPEGFTHDWDLYVRGSNKADISAYVDKVVFNLHESFQRPKRAIKEPPYVIHESGYASFMLNIDIYFRNRDEPKRVQYTYDLDLQNQGPPHHRSEEKKFLFENPSEEFRQKLLKGGGVPVVPAGLTGSRSGNPNILPSSFIDANNASTIKHKSSNNNTDGSGSSSGSSKKHKSRIDDSKLNTFANLFGTPDAGAKSSSSIASKNITESLKTSSGNGAVKVYSPSSSSTASSINAGKEKSSKEGKEKSSSSSNSAEKSKDKSERKEKHKSASNSSPTKEPRNDSKKVVSNPSVEPGKTEKRSEDKPKKDKSRDKDRDRNRNEPSLGTTPNASGIKSSSGSKSGGSASSTPVPTQQTMLNAPGIAAGNTPAQRTPTQATANAPNRAEEKAANASSKSEKSEKETKEKHSSSSSSSKKSKKEKKDKDKDKERDKEKRSSGESKSKDERTHVTALQTNISNSPSGQTASSTLPAGLQAKTTTISSKKTEKDNKQDTQKAKSSSISEKAAEKQVSALAAASNNGVPSSLAADKKATSSPAVSNSVNSGINSSSSNTTSSKTHKHKKKDKNKDKDKDKDRSSSGDKEKDKSKDKHNKEKPEEKRETEKPSEIATAKSKSPELQKTATPPASLLPPSTATNVPAPQSKNSLASNANTSGESTASSKKSQNKEKKSKDSKSSKDAKRRSESANATSEPKSKVSKTSTPLSTAGSNIELSDADSRQSTHDTLKSTPTAPSVAPISTVAPDLHSDSSYSSFPDIPVKQSEKSAVPTSISSPEKSNSSSRNSTVGSKENKQREKEKNTSKSSDKSSKTEKEEKKRRRNTVTATPEATTFVEPPVKQAKKEQSKATTPRDSTKSPLPRTNSGGVGAVSTNANTIKGGNTKNQAETNNQDIEATATILTASPNAAAATFASNAATNHANNVVNNSTQQRTTPLPASPALNNDTIWPNLSELQELHRKIMTLQDNDDLQQVVEMIAASGCYELTQRTFDFDLCKLDRSTVERLQEFFATSVS